MFDHILVPIDGSPLTAFTLPVVADLARRHNSSVTLLYVSPRPAVTYGEPTSSYDPAEDRRRMQAKGLQRLEVAHTALKYPTAELLYVDDGAPEMAQAIADVAQRQGVALVVMGSHGRSGLAHFKRGSITEGVMRRVEVPVLVVRTPKSAASMLDRADAWQTLPTPEVCA
ncbi:universal stress protein [Deinococcus detaillensis]|uniref:Universal stress protein n=1 Tax=Deinococcus detaillensis TaxID=2592048 RepID=A0A553UFU9_9DEIO|nr:universal stress protein [Deinococcus detaillensis]TSA79062.1 universal stress protein [Deinococcus detaillensis]